MISREEKNKKYVDEINKEKTIKVTKISLKILLVIVILFTITFMYAKFYEPNRFVTHEYLIKDISIPDEFNGIKILHFSDILYGSINLKQLEKISEEIKLINPDIVFFTGNVIRSDYQVNGEEIKMLNNFFKTIPYSIGKYIVLGDTDNQMVNLILEDSNFTILKSELISIYNGLNKINLIGISYNEAQEIKNESNDYTITIINNYDEIDKYNISSNLILAGHNLGGEIRLFNLPLLGLDKHLNSYYEENNSQIYISNGLGSIHNLRFLNKPSMNVYRFYNK